MTHAERTHEIEDLRMTLLNTMVAILELDPNGFVMIQEIQQEAFHVAGAMIAAS